MSTSAAELLTHSYGIDPSRVEIVPHGVPNLPLVDPDSVKPQLGLEGRTVILSFGLLGPGKGYESVIAAMPARRARRSPTRSTSSSARRIRSCSVAKASPTGAVSQTLAASLGVADHVRFVGRFVDAAELRTWLLAADIFVTPYPNLEQIVSGTLSYAMGAGKAIVSTPYRLRQRAPRPGPRPTGRSRARPSPWPRRSSSWPGTRRAARSYGQRAYDHSRGMHWPRGGGRVPSDLRTRRAWLVRHPVDPCPDRHAGGRGCLTEPLPPVCRQHLEAMTGPLGIWQHADGVTARPGVQGTCTDDVARALTVDLLHRHALGWEAVRPSARRAMSYLEAAFDEDRGTFRNFRAANGDWLDDGRSQDSQGRALLALGIAAREAAEVRPPADGAARCSTAAAGRRRPADLAAGRRIGDPRAATRRSMAARSGPTKAALRAPRRAPRPALRRHRPGRRLAVAGGGADVRERPAAARPDRGRTAPRRTPACAGSAWPSSTG